MQSVAFNTFWLLVFAGILLAGQGWKRVRIFRGKMVRQWEAALTITVIYLSAFLLGTGFNPGMFLTETIGAYHLSPLDSFYLTFWQHPMREFLSKAFVGILWGFIYTWRGYETVVLSHTLSNWFPFVLFT